MEAYLFLRLFRHRGLGINLLAGFSFLMLAVYGWGFSWDTLGGYLLIIFGLLIGLISIAALLGFLLRKTIRTRSAVTAQDSKNK